MREARSATDPVFQAIAAVRVVRDFADRPLGPDHLDRILQAGRHAGSSKNLQRWTFIVCRDRGRLVELAKVGPWAGHLAGAAAAIALVTPDPRGALVGYFGENARSFGMVLRSHSAITGDYGSL